MKSFNGSYGNSRFVQSMVQTLSTHCIMWLSCGVDDSLLQTLSSEEFAPGSLEPLLVMLHTPAAEPSVSSHPAIQASSYMASKGGFPSWFANTHRKTSNEASRDAFCVGERGVSDRGWKLEFMGDMPDWSRCKMLLSWSRKPLSRKIALSRSCHAQ